MDYELAPNEEVVVCEECGAVIAYEPCDVVLKPWPHVDCCQCNSWIPLFQNRSEMI